MRIVGFFAGCHCWLVQQCDFPGDFQMSTSTQTRFLNLSKHGHSARSPAGSWLPARSIRFGKNLSDVPAFYENHQRPSRFIEVLSPSSRSQLSATTKLLRGSGNSCHNIPSQCRRVPPPARPAIRFHTRLGGPANSWPSCAAASWCTIRSRRTGRLACPTLRLHLRSSTTPIAAGLRLNMASITNQQLRLHCHRHFKINRIPPLPPSQNRRNLPTLASRLTITDDHSFLQPRHQT
jgi:hypothetical protein